MAIRQARPGDAADIAAVYIDSWRRGYAEALPEEYLASLSVERATSVWRGALTSPRLGTTTMVSTNDGFIEGVVQYGPTREKDLDTTSWGEVTMLYVASGVWGRGVGGALLRQSVDGLRAAGFTAAHLWVLDGNRRAERLYARNAWVRMDRVKVDDTRGVQICEAFWTRDLGTGASPTE